MSEQELLQKAAPPSNVYAVRVESVKHYTDRLFAFTCERPAALRFRSGEFVMIGLMAGERPLLRAYSIASPAWDDRLAFYSIKVPDGPLTSRLQNIVAGDEILVGRKPTGTLFIDYLRPGRRLYLLSTGTGLGPFLSVVRDPATYEKLEQVILVHGVRTVDELAYHDLLLEHLPAHEFLGDLVSEQLRYYPTVTRQSYRNMGRITELIESGKVFADLGMPALSAHDDRVMICGSPAMLRDLKHLLEQRGLAEGNTSTPGDFIAERAFAER